MTNTKLTRRALLSSVLALVLCFTMLLGTTFAWFTDEAVSGGNKIVAGNLEVDLVDENDTSLVGNAELFVSADGKTSTDILWEPGATYNTIPMYVKNNGNLALKYQFIVNVAGKDAVKLLDAITFTVKVGDNEYGLDEFKGELAKAGDKSDAIVISGHMDEGAGNEYKNLEATLTVTVVATQLAYEKDSFDDQYDVDSEYDSEATSGVVVNGATYATVNEAMTAVAEMTDDVVLTIKGAVELSTGSSHGNIEIAPKAKSVTIVGDDADATLTVVGGGVPDIVGKNLTFKNLTIADEGTYNANSWYFRHQNFSGKIVFENVSFVDGVLVGTNHVKDFTPNVTFTDCTFDSGVADEYALWITDGLVSVTNCTFTGARGIKVHGDSGSQATVTVDSCTFDSLSAKPGFAFGTIDTVATLVTIKNCEFIDCQPGDGAEDPTKGVACVYETDTAAGAWLVLDGNASFEPVLISTAEELMNFASAINGGESYAGKVVKLTGDIDLGGSEWTPIGQTGTSYGATNYFQGVFDGQGYTIKNFKITETNGGANYAAGLFGFIDAADATIKNLNVDNAEVNGHHWTGVIAGYITGSITNCTVTNSKVVCTHANNDACGDKAGIITGYVNAGTVTGNTVKDCTVKAGRDGGQVAGAAKTTQVYGNTVINVTVTATGDCTGANISNAEIGRIMG